MVLKRCKSGFNTGNSFGRRRFNYLKRMGVSKYGWIVAGARVSGGRRLLRADDAMSALSDRLQLQELSSISNGHREKYDDGTLYCESVAHSLNKKQRWRIVANMIESCQQQEQLMHQLDCAVSFLAIERPQVRQESKLKASYNNCVTSANFGVQMPTRSKKLSRKHEWIGRLCPVCHALVEKISGCDHMTCDICHSAFCWRCMQARPFGMNHHRCVPVQDKVITLQDVTPLRDSSVLDELNNLNISRQCPTLVVKASANNGQAIKLHNCQRVRVVRAKAHHNQHFRGVQRPAHVKLETEMCRASRKHKKHLADKSDKHETAPPASVDPLDAEYIKPKVEITQQCPPHVMLGVEIPVLPSCLTLSKLTGVKVGQNTLKRATKLPHAELQDAYCAATEDDQMYYNELSDDQLFEEERDGEYLSQSAERISRSFGLMDFVRTEQRNRHGGRRASSRKLQLESVRSESPFSVISPAECEQGQEFRSDSPVDTSFVFV